GLLPHPDAGHVSVEALRHRGGGSLTELLAVDDVERDAERPLRVPSRAPGDDDAIERLHRCRHDLFVRLALSWREDDLIRARGYGFDAGAGEELEKDFANDH